LILEQFRYYNFTEQATIITILLIILTEFIVLKVLRHMKENNKSKFAMNIFHQARNQIALIAGLLGQSADAG